MKRSSDLRDRKIWDRRETGEPKYHYYCDLFDRWMRHNAATFTVPACDSLYASVTNVKFSVVNCQPDQEKMLAAISEIRRCITNESVRRHFDMYVFCGNRSDDFVVVYVKGHRRVLDSRAKVNRMAELFQLYTLVSFPRVLDDMFSGLGKLMAERAQ